MQVESLEKAVHEYGFLPWRRPIDFTLCEPGENIRWGAWVQGILIDYGSKVPWRNASPQEGHRQSALNKRKLQRVLLSSWQAKGFPFRDEKAVAWHWGGRFCSNDEATYAAIVYSTGNYWCTASVSSSRADRQETELKALLYGLRKACRLQVHIKRP